MPPKKIESQPTRRIGALGFVGRVLTLVLSFWLMGQGNAQALVFSSPDFEPENARPDDFPYWENITQRRFEGPSVIYLGAGWAMTARHVGPGEIILKGQIFNANFLSRHTLLNINGTTADAVVFQLAADSNLPDLPILPLVKEAPRPGEEVLLIGFGRGRRNVIQWHDQGRIRFGFEWSKRGSKRWGTNRVDSNTAVIFQGDQSTHALSFVFDEPNTASTTRHEAHAATGDSGGAVFVKRDDKWLLAGMMTSISADTAVPAQTATYGDTTYAADISFYRTEILRWARPRCANEKDDDGDRKIDFPLDPGCRAPEDQTEQDTDPIADAIGIPWTAALAGSCAIGALLLWIFRNREYA